MSGYLTPISALLLKSFSVLEAAHGGGMAKNARNNVMGIFSLILYGIFICVEIPLKSERKPLTY